MDAIELFSKSGESTGFWICGKCRRVTLNPLYSFARNDGQEQNTREAAELCCRDPICTDCKKEFKPHGWQETPVCGDCRTATWRKEELERREKRIAAADEVEDDGNMVCCEEIGYHDGWFKSVDELVEYLEDEWIDDEWIDDETVQPNQWPEFCFASVAEVRSLDVRQALEEQAERRSEDGYEEMEIELDAELIAAVDAFNLRNQGTMTVYQVDYSRKIRIPPREVKSE